MRADAVLSGGGVKVIALAGAVAGAEAAGWRWESLGGASGGAVVAALLAAGYTGEELGRLLVEAPFPAFADRLPVSRLPLLGAALALALRKGLCRGDALEAWLASRLAVRGVRTFGDLRCPGETEPRFQHRLQVVAADATRGQLAVLPADLPRYGLDPDRFPVARAVRMSAGLPLFYVPVLLTGPLAPASSPSLMVDGGIVANFPVWLFDVGGSPPWPTFGFRLAEPARATPPVRGLASYVSRLVNTALSAREELANAHALARTIAIPSPDIATTAFDLDRGRRQELYQAGAAAAAAFLSSWDFADYRRRFRGAAAPGSGAGSFSQSRQPPPAARRRQPWPPEWPR